MINEIEKQAGNVSAANAGIEGMQKAPPLDRRDWYFELDAVSEFELRACAIYEFSRESRYIGWLVGNRNKYGAFPKAVDAEFQSTFTLSYPYNASFLGFEHLIRCGIVGPQCPPWQSLTPQQKQRIQKYACSGPAISAATYLGFLAIKEKTDRAIKRKIDEFRQQQQAAKRKLKNWEISNQGKYGGKRAMWSPCPLSYAETWARLTGGSEAPRRTGNNLRDITGLINEKDWGDFALFHHPEPRARFLETIEVIPLYFHWGAATNAQMTKAFAQFLRENRPMEFPEPDVNVKESDRRNALRGLGLMRLRKTRTIGKLLIAADTKDYLRELRVEAVGDYSTRGFDRLIDDRRKFARSFFFRLFPFEKYDPISWGTPRNPR